MIIINTTTTENNLNVHITGKEIVENIIDVLHENDSIIPGRNTVMTTHVRTCKFTKQSNTLDKNTADNIWRLFELFIPNTPIGSKTFLSKEFNDIYTTAIYYFFFTKANGYEPFNLTKTFYNYLQTGGEYGWYGNPFIICTHKKIAGNTLKVNTLYCNSNAGLPVFSEEKTDNFCFDNTNTKFFEEILKFEKMFQYPNFKHYPSPLQQLSLIEATEKSIELNKNALKIIRQIKK